MSGGARGRPRFLLVLGFAAIAWLYLAYAAIVIMLMIAARKHGSPDLGTGGRPLPQYDFARFWYVGKESFLERAAAFGFPVRPSPWLRQNLPLNILRPDSAGAMWLYPPTMNLLAIPFSFIPLASSFWVWRAASILLAGILLRRAGLAWIVIVAGLFGPAGMRDLFIGQNGTFTAGLLVAALLQVDRRPSFAGICAGLLCLKPQIGVALPLILLHPRRRKALLVGIGMILALVLLSFPLLGLQPWLVFLRVAQPVAAEIITTPFAKVVSPGGTTVFLMARSFSATVAQAGILQALTALTALVVLAVAWRDQTSEPVARMALTVSLSLLIMPYGYSYDLVAFSVAMASLSLRATDGAKLWFLALWVFAGYTTTLATVSGHIFMPLAAAMGAYLSWRAGRPHKFPKFSVMPGSTGEEEAA